MRWECLAAILVVVTVGGCLDGEPEPLPPEMQQAAVETPTPEATPAEQPPAVAKANEQPAAPAPAPAPVAKSPVVDQPKQPPAPAPQPGTVSHPAKPRSEQDEQWATPEEAAKARRGAEADVGMGKQGQGYGKDPFTYALAANFRMREKIILQQIKRGMQMFEVQNGRLPNSQKEFREKILKPRALKMPPLPPGKKYYYDASQGMLTVIDVP